MKESLNDLALKHGTDKASSHPAMAGHDYCRHYETVFEPLRELPVKLLEIGVDTGVSIKLWLDYFPNATVFGVDVNHSQHPYNTVGSGIDPRYTFVTGDQSCETFWKCFVADYGSDWDIIIDDGSHVSKDVLTSFKMLWPSVAHGGLYCIEDLAVAYVPMYCTEGWQNHMDFVKDKLDDINRLDEIESLHFYKELAILRKTR